LKEIVKIRIGVVPVFDKTPTKYKILVDNALLFESQSAFVSGQVQYHDLSIDLDPGAHSLNIRLDPDSNQFENIEIVDVTFNGLKLRSDDLFLMSKYLLDEPRMIDGQMCTQVDQCNVIGWAGTYQIAFTTPIMAWFIRNF
jgi:hypothetical protein